MEVPSGTDVDAACDAIAEIEGIPEVTWGMLSRAAATVCHVGRGAGAVERGGLENR